METKKRNVVGMLKVDGEDFFVIGHAPVDKEIFGGGALGFTVVKNVDMNPLGEVGLYNAPFYLVVKLGQGLVFTADYANLPKQIETFVSELEDVEEKPTDIEPDEEPETNQKFE